MSKQISITGITTANTTATEVTITGHPPIKSIVSGAILVSHIAAATTDALKTTALTVVAVPPDADGKIQRTADNKFKLYLTVGATVNDVIALIVEEKGQLVTP